MNILITGVTGRVGANLAARLLQLGHQVRGLVWPRDPRTEKLRSIGVELVTGSLTSPADVTRSVTGMDIIYHLGAAFQGGGPFTNEEYFEINVRGTFNLLEAARNEGSIRHFLYAGTDAVLNKYIPGGVSTPITEAFPKAPAGPYALTKLLGEELCIGYWLDGRLPTTSLRFAIVFGAGEILHFPQFYLSGMRAGHPALESLWTGEDRLLILRDENGRPYKKHVADVRDIVSGLLAALGKEASFGEVIQIAGPSAFTWDTVIPWLSDRLGIPYSDVRLSGVPTYYEMDLSKARTLIDFEPEYDVFRMIHDALCFERGEDIGLIPT